MFRFLNEVAIVAQLAGHAFERVMPGEMTLPQFVVLNHLVRRGGRKTPLDLARAMQVVKGAMTNTLGHLERQGFIVIVPDETDGRSKRVDISVPGRAAHAAAIESIGPDLRHILDHVPVARIAAGLPLLESVRKVLDERRGL